MAKTMGYFRPARQSFSPAGRLTANLLAMATIWLNTSLVWCQAPIDIDPSFHPIPSLSQYALSEPPPLPELAPADEPLSLAPRQPSVLPPAPCEQDAQGPQIFEHGPFRKLLGRVAEPRPDGMRVARESWQRRPLSVTWFMGAVSGSSLIGDWLREGNGMMGSLALGWDFNDYWGTEFRLGVGTPELHDSDRALAARDLLYGADQTGWANRDWIAYRGGRQGDLFQVGVNALCYPWGDSPWRPYLMTGVGATIVSVDDVLGRRYNTTMFTMPLGAGVKYHWTDWMALRLEVADNIAFSNGGLRTLHNFAVLGAVEVRFGGSRKSYWPWIPSRNSW